MAGYNGQPLKVSFMYRYEIKCVLGSKRTNIFSCAVLAGIALLAQVKAMDYAEDSWWIDLVDHCNHRHKYLVNPRSYDLLHSEWVQIVP